MNDRTWVMSTWVPSLFLLLKLLEYSCAVEKIDITGKKIILDITGYAKSWDLYFKNYLPAAVKMVFIIVEKYKHRYRNINIIQVISKSIIT